MASENTWIICDDNGVVYSGPFDEIQLIWDFITRDINDLVCEYKDTYTKRELIQKKKELHIQWKGDLKLIEIHNIWNG